MEPTATTALVPGRRYSPQNLLASLPVRKQILDPETYPPRVTSLWHGLNPWRETERMGAITLGDGAQIQSECKLSCPCLKYS